jgi:hypothetical protein
MEPPFTSSSTNLLYGGIGYGGLEAETSASLTYGNAPLA